MPYRRRTTTRPPMRRRTRATRRPLRRRPTRRNYRSRRGVSRLPNRITSTYQIGFPDYRRIRMRYCDFATLNGAAGALTYITYGMNCLWDPYLSTGGHSAMGFEQALIFYDAFLVTGSKMIVKFQCSDSSLNVPVKCGIIVTIDPTLNYTDWREMQESGAATNTLITYSNRPVYAKAFFSARKLIGQNPDELTQQANIATANPTRKGYAHIWVQSCDTTSSIDNIVLDIKIDYLTKCVGKKNIAPSGFIVPPP